jgi:diaminohydroxyphosphoribosylaminopyrimidine deaminase/5-amino-6-(5-phosphoribosylamino)uracil reductase
MNPNPIETRFMRRAIQLSRKGFPAPNPHVGCVIVSNGEIVGEGFHDHAGGPHAEAAALSVAGENARGADVYVTLEPCNHHGRTPPCSLALIAAGVRRVVVANADLNPKAQGGAAALLAAGIEVDLGLLADLAADANRFFLQSHSLGRPYVVVKAAVTLDGRIAMPSGESKWITGPKARAESHRLRAECGAVLVGRKTVEADDPQLTARFRGVVNQPLRVVLDPSGRLHSNYRVFSREAETWHETGHIDLAKLMAKLTRAGHIGLLVEGGAATIGRFIQADLVDEIKLFIAPKIVGKGTDWLAEFAAPSLEMARYFRFGKPRILGNDTELSAFRIRQ